MVTSNVYDIDVQGSSKINDIIIITFQYAAVNETTVKVIAGEVIILLSWDVVQMKNSSFSMV